MLAAYPPLTLDGLSEQKRQDPVTPVSRTIHPFSFLEHSAALVLSLTVGLQVLAVGCKSAGDRNVSGTAEAASPGAAAATSAAGGEPTPPEAIPLTTKTGQSFRLSSYNWDLSHAPNLGGVPTASGLEIPMNYVSRVEFGVRSDKWSANDPATGSWPVTITLLEI